MAMSIKRKEKLKKKRAKRKAKRDKKIKHLNEIYQYFDDFERPAYYHWQKRVNKKILDYWPSTGRFRYDGETYFGDTHKVRSFIKCLEEGGELDHVIPFKPRTILRKA